MSDTNWAWAGGAAFLAAAWVLYVFLAWTASGEFDFFMTKLWQGKDGRGSFSKFQFWLWAVIISFCLISLWTARIIAANGLVKPFGDLPENLLVILGFSAATSLVAKTITTDFVARGLIQKPAPPANPRPFTELLVDDSDIPDLSKFQMFLFTIVAMVIFVSMVANRIDRGFENELIVPDVSSTLLLLMGVSTSGYLGKKLITRE